MGKRIAAGDRMPFFQYDTPYSIDNSFRQLLADTAPLVLVFMSNFGHPVTRTFVSRYSHTRYKLTGGGFAMVVKSEPDKLAPNVGPHSLPYPLICDAEGVLYEYLDIPTRSGVWRTCSLEAWQILRKARQRGYSTPAGAPQQMPLTLILDADGTVLFSHYGSSLTDVPADCGAMQQLLAELDLLPDGERAGDRDDYDDGEAAFAPDGEAGEEEDREAETAFPAPAAQPPAGRSTRPSDHLTDDDTMPLSQTVLLGLLDDPYEDEDD